MDNQRFDLWLKFARFIVGTVVIGIATIIVNSQIQKREVDIKEMEMLGKFIDHAIDGNVAVRYRFADYFATVSRSQDIRNRWEKYKQKIDEEFNKIDSVASGLKKEKEAEMEKAVALQEKLLETQLEVKRLSTELNRKTALADKDELKKQIEEQQKTLKAIQTETFKHEDKLAVVQTQLNEANAEITYPNQMIQRQASPRSGWVYLGEFDTNSNIWTKTNWDFAHKSKPESLKGKTIRVVIDAINLRSSGDPWARILDVLKFNSAVHIENIKAWESTNYFWAQVTIE